MMERKQKIRSQEVQDILTKMPNWLIIWGNTIILIMIIVFFMATWFIKYPDVISGDTKITSRNPIYKVIANKSGRIDSIFVKENDTVSQDQIIAIIKNNANLGDVLTLKRILDTISIRVDNLSFPLEALPLMSLGELGTSYALFENEFLNLRLRNSLKYFSLHQNGSFLSISSLKKQLKLLEEQKALEIQNLELSRDNFERYKALFDDGVISYNEFEIYRIDYINKKKSLKNIDISIGQTNQSLIESNRASQEVLIANELEKNSLFKKTIHAMNALREDIKLWEEKYLLRSEIDGKVSLIGMWNKNQAVSQGDHICSIIPDQTGGYIARLKAPETNSGKIRKGQKVNIKLYNYPESEYGFISGNISSISALPSPEGYYWVEVTLPNKLQTSYSLEIPFKPEMSGTAEIITEDLRLCERFFYRLKGIIS